ncbi:hypothetical protein FHS76_004315 [Ochrobactrum daejeonense]|uniref:Shedu protein SduA C-terminal domain-containing protein n=1 Tax=Brucella daejeonensis TaxID=659015 RepID=A0A7W9ENC5_9HYPH|nr:Shedu anti-phage system protein SduA domain-containing protein [Brucella daejeonensis]MBB5704398.1 hypothetical protein [Brucella daejeonensis]
MTFSPEELEPQFLKDFRLLLDSPKTEGKQKEQEVQDYIESNTELFYPQFRTHQGVYLRRIISKFKVSTKKTTDFAYISADSDTVNVVFVEIESPLKKIFTTKTDEAVFDSSFNKAIQQVESWRIAIEQNRSEILDRLAPLLPTQRQRTEFKYALVYGRSDDKTYENRRKVFSDKKTHSGILISTYDNLIEAYKNQETKLLNVLAQDGDGFRFKHMHLSPEHDFARLLPDQLHLSNEQIERLRAEGYEIDAWLSGRYLSVNSKYTSAENAMKAAGFSRPVATS